MYCFIIYFFLYNYCKMINFFNYYFYICIIVFQSFHRDCYNKCDKVIKTFQDNISSLQITKINSNEIYFSNNIQNFFYQTNNNKTHIINEYEQTTNGIQPLLMFDKEKRLRYIINTQKIYLFHDYFVEGIEYPCSTINGNITIMTQINEESFVIESSSYLQYYNINHKCSAPLTGVSPYNSGQKYYKVFLAIDNDILSLGYNWFYVLFGFTIDNLMLILKHLT